MVRYSGLQREVLAFYRQCVREIRKKPQESRHNFVLFLRAQFQQSSHVSKTDFGAIEYLLRRGRNQLEIYSSDSVRNVG
ncbi:uncharacterized protein V1510DRAFT_381756 [Dipodascopsis tothii]|uniref:uncharacterized protein n=1 Tax=Dipodascopsis tothii TaxID=44089 RepID=UPI0034CDF46F